MAKLQINEKFLLKKHEKAEFIKGSNQAISSGAYTNVALNSFTTTSSNFFIQNGNGIRVLKKGKYLIDYYANINSSSVDWKLVGIGINTTANFSQGITSMQGLIGISTINNSRIVDLEKNDTVYMNSYNYGGALQVTSDFQITRLIIYRLD